MLHGGEKKRLEHLIIGGEEGGGKVDGYRRLQEEVPSLYLEKKNLQGCIWEMCATERWGKYPISCSN